MSEDPDKKGFCEGKQTQFYIAGLVMMIGLSFTVFLEICSFFSIINKIVDG
jgi:hypothetical protein